MTNAREIDGFCTDCGNWTDLLGPIGDRRCRCGSGRVAVPPAGYRILGPDEVDPVTEDDVAAELWKAEAEDAGSPASIANGRTRDAFDDQSDELKRRWRKFARAAIRALGRKA